MLLRWQHGETGVDGNEVPSSCLGHVAKDMLGKVDPGWIIALSEAILLNSIAIVPQVVLVLIIAMRLEDALHAFIADGLLGLFVGGLPMSSWACRFSLFLGWGPSASSSTPWP